MKKQLLLLVMMLLPMVASADDSGNCGDNVTYTYMESTHTLTISGTGSMTNYAWECSPWYTYRSEIIKVIIEDGVTSIGTYAFYDCSGLTSITIPNSVTSIADYAFKRCIGLTSVTIPNSVTRIGANTFGGCKSLISVTIPNSVTSIANEAFSDCSSLTSITIPDGVTSIGASTFSNCKSLTSVTIPNSVTSIADYTFNRCIGLTSVMIPNSVTSIGINAFLRCIALTSITIPNSVTSIGNGAFGGCSSLSNVISEILFPFEISESVFTVYSTATLTVPNGTKMDYRLKRCWNMFTNIVESNSQNNDVPFELVYYPRKVVMEEATGTGCGWCVRGIETIEKMKEEYPDNFIAIALHRGDMMSKIYNYDAISRKILANPGCLFNRSVNGPFDVDLYGARRKIEQLKDYAIATITASATYTYSDMSEVKVSTETTFGFNKENADYRIAYVVVEDNVGPYMQNNAYSNNERYNDPSDYMYNWFLKSSPTEVMFNDVARGIYGSADGEEGSIPSSVTLGQPYSYEYTFTLPDNIDNISNIRIITLLLDANTGEIVNADQTTISKTFDTNGDGAVNAADIVELVNYIMNSPSAIFNEKAADINGDGVVNAADIVEIVKIIMAAE